jgi:hypothetical protein
MTGPKVEENCRFHALAFDVALRRAPDTSPIIGIAQERSLSLSQGSKITKGFARARRAKTHLWRADSSRRKAGDWRVMAEVSVLREREKLSAAVQGNLILTARIWVCRDDDAGQGKLRSRQKVSPTSPVGGQKKPTVA